MGIFLAGATGAIGKRLIPMLIASGHYVIAATRAQDKVGMLRTSGAEPAVVDALDRDAVMKAVTSARPEVVVHQVTALAKMGNLKNFDKEFALTNRLRTEGTDNLLAAARAVGARRWIVQAIRAGPTSVRAGASRLKATRLTLARHRRCGGRSMRFVISRQRPASPTCRGSSSGMAASMGRARRWRLTAPLCRWSGSASSQSSGMARAYGPSSTSMTRRWRPAWRLNTDQPVSSISLMMSQRRWRCGCRSWRAP